MLCFSKDLECQLLYTQYIYHKLCMITGLIWAFMLHFTCISPRWWLCGGDWPGAFWESSKQGTRNMLVLWRTFVITHLLSAVIVLWYWINSGTWAGSLILFKVDYINGTAETERAATLLLRVKNGEACSDICVKDTEGAGIKSGLELDNTVLFQMSQLSYLRQFKSLQLSNAFPKHLKDLHGARVGVFMNRLDLFPARVPDELISRQETKKRKVMSNSRFYQIPII